MPLLNDKVLLALKDNKLTDALALIQADNALVNSIDKDGYSILQLLLMDILPRDKLPEIVVYIVTQPSFMLSASAEGQTQSNLKSIISSARIDILLLIKDHSQMVFTEKKLSYELAVKSLATAQKTLDDVQKQNKGRDVIDRAAFRVNNLVKIVALLRDASILHAIKNDDKSLMDALQKAGARPTENLGAAGKNVVPVTLLKPTDKVLSAWFKAQTLAQQNAEQQAKSAPASAVKPVLGAPVNSVAAKFFPAPTARPEPVNSAAAKPVPVPAAKPASSAPDNYAAAIDAIGLLAQLERQREQLEVNYHKARANIYAKATDETLADIDKVIAIASTRVKV